MSDDFYDEYEEDGFDEDDDSTSVIPCPNCRADVYEEAVSCPHCGEYIIHDGHNSPLAGRPVWFVLLGLCGIIAVILVLSGLLGF